MARRIYAGADVFVMPSRFEPCGQGQMIALRYGTPPIVHRTGGLADTVVDEVRAPGAGTGFVFDEATAEGLLGGLRGVQRDPGGRRSGLGGACSIAAWRSTSTGRRARRRATSRRIERAIEIRQGWGFGDTRFGGSVRWLMPIGGITCDAAVPR